MDEWKCFLTKKKDQIKLNCEKNFVNSFAKSMFFGE